MKTETGKYVFNFRRPLFWLSVLAVIVITATALFCISQLFSGYEGDDIDDDGLSGVTGEGEIWFDAVILELHDDMWLVKPCTGTNELKTSDRIYIKIPETRDDLGFIYGVRSKVRIFYDGMIQETYPAKIPNVYSIELVEKFKTNIFYKSDTAYVKHITDKTDPVFTKAVNAEYLSETNSPVHIFDNYGEMKSFLENYDLGDDNAWGVEYLLEKFDEEYFAENSVILIYAVESTHLKNTVSKVGRIDDSLWIDFAQMYLDNDTPFGYECRFFAVGTKKSNLDGCKYFYASVHIDPELQ